jgi:hypothetical protein
MMPQRLLANRGLSLPLIGSYIEFDISHARRIRICHNRVLKAVARKEEFINAAR